MITSPSKPLCLLSPYPFRSKLLSAGLKGTLNGTPKGPQNPSTYPPLLTLLARRFLIPEFGNGCLYLLCFNEAFFCWDTSLSSLAVKTAPLLNTHLKCQEADRLWK